MSVQSLSETAMLAKLSVSCWSGRKYDAKATEEVEANHNAKDAGRFNKLLVRKAAIAKVNNAATALRRKHYELTLPWRDEGSRILTAKGFVRYSDEIRKLRGEYEQAAEEFCREYSDLIDEARENLNGLFRESDYPAVEHIRRKFDCEVDFSPLPTSGDFRVNLADDVRAAIKADIEAKSDQTVRDAMRDVWSRLYNVVHTMARGLDRFGKVEDGNSKANTFRNSLVDNVRDLCGLLPALNLTDDPRLESMRQQVEAGLCSAPADVLRENRHEREKTRAEANAILDSLAAVMGTEGSQPVKITEVGSGAFEQYVA